MSLASNTSEKQGFLGDLNSKSTWELTELLQRQQAIMKNIKFIKKLPDKGAKIQQMIDRLNELLEGSKNVDDTANMFEKMAIDADKSQKERLQTEVAGSDDENDDPLKHIINPGQQDKVVKDKRQDKYINSYERVIKRTSKSSTKTNTKPPKDKFMPHRTVRTKDVDELSQHLDIVDLKKSEETKIPKDFDPTEGHMKTEEPKTQNRVSLDPVDEERSCSDTDNSVRNSDTHKCADSNASSFDKHLKNKGFVHHGERKREVTGHAVTAHSLKELGQQPGVKLKYRYDESLLPPTASKHSAAKVIALDDAIVLQQQQKKHLDQVQAEHAAQKLAERLGVRMGEFRVEGSAGYRQQEEEEQMDSDEEEQELDYPD